ncbi:MAG: hypothetical protein COB53_05590, partial [Elusimicrobia bacterium]
MLVVSLGTSGFGGLWYYRTAKSSLDRAYLSKLEAVAGLQKSRLNAVVAFYLHGVKSITSRSDLRFQLDKSITLGKAESRNALNLILKNIKSTAGTFQEISLLDLEGRIVASTELDLIGTKHKDEKSFEEGKKANGLVRLFKDQHNILRVELAGPVRFASQMIGVAKVVANAEKLIELTEDYTGLGETGESVIAERAPNGDALFIVPLRFDGDAALTRRISKDKREIPILQALQGKEDAFTRNVRDYRGIAVLATTRFIEGLGWGIVVKIDAAEAHAPIEALKWRLLIGNVLLWIGMILACVRLSKTITQPILQLTEAARKISSGDLSHRVDVVSNDEIGSLAVSFNEMTESLNKKNAELKSEKDYVENILRSMADAFI